MIKRCCWHCLSSPLGRGMFSFIHSGEADHTTLFLWVHLFLWAKTSCWRWCLSREFKTTKQIISSLKCNIVCVSACVGTRATYCTIVSEWVLQRFIGFVYVCVSVLYCIVALMNASVICIFCESFQCICKCVFLLACVHGCDFTRCLLHVWQCICLSGFWSAVCVCLHTLCVCVCLFVCCSCM